MEIQWGTAVDALRSVIALIPNGQLNGIIEDMKDADKPREEIDLISQLREG